MKKIIFLVLAILLTPVCKGDEKSEKIQKLFDSISKEIKAQYAPDRRVKTYEPFLFFPKDGSVPVLKGSTTEAGAKEALLKALAANKIKVVDSMVVLPDPALKDKIYGIAALSVINFRYGPDYAEESATQTIMGTPLRILEKRGGWTRAVTPEGYIAWVTSGSIMPMNEKEYMTWSLSPRLIITAYYTLFRDAPSETSPVVSDGVMGCIVRADGESGDYYKVILPNGKKCFVQKTNATDFENWVDSRNPTPENIISTAKQFIGFPYMWGGTSIKAMDCSGFAKTSYYLNGVILERDASQQALYGDSISTANNFEALKAGDLIFFGSKATPDRRERISHVGIYLGGGEFIHSATSVRINSLIPSASNYYEGSNRLVRVRRIIPQIDKIKGEGILSIKNHPWYFPDKTKTN
jgi:hypothetical protein